MSSAILPRVFRIISEGSLRLMAPNFSALANGGRGGLYEFFERLSMVLRVYSGHEASAEVGHHLQEFAIFRDSPYIFGSLRGGQGLYLCRPPSGITYQCINEI